YLPQLHRENGRQPPDHPRLRYARQSAHPIGEQPRVAEHTRPRPQPQRSHHSVRREIAHAHELDLAHAKHRKPPQHERRAEPGQHEQRRRRDAQQRPLPPTRPWLRHAPAPPPPPPPPAGRPRPAPAISPAPPVNTTPPARPLSPPPPARVAPSPRPAAVP